MTVSRRTLLRSAGAVGLAAGAASLGVASAATGPGARDWQALDAGLAGTVELPGTTGYDTTRRLNDPRFDGVRPPAVARCATGDDVAEVIAFARRFGLPVVTRGGGHSYVGASTSGTGIVIDTRPLNGIRRDAATGTATIGGGALLADVYERLAADGVSIPAGSCGTVGIGGSTLGGGIGMASSQHGLTCDAVVAAELVTADGRRRTVDARREPELFWALRGGGGGQVGVVTSWRMRTFPVSTVGSFVLTFAWGDAARVAAGWQARLAGQPDRAWSTLQFSADARGRTAVRLSGFTLAADAQPEVDALLRLIRRSPVTTRVERRGYLDVVRARAGDGERDTELIGSDVFPRALPAAGITALTTAIARRAAARRPGIAKLKPLTNAVSRPAPDATAFAWRGAYTMLQWLVYPTATDAATVRDAYTWIADGHRAVAAYSAGRYVNYLEPDTGALARYYGPNLDRLRRVRAAADPTRLFQSAYAVA